MKKTKKVLAFCLATIMVFSLTACGQTSNTAGNNDTTSSGKNASTVKAEDTTNVTEAAAVASGVIARGDLQVDTSRKSTSNSDERLAELDVAQSISATDLSPYNYSDAALQHLMFYEPLFHQTGTQDFEPELAKSYQAVDDTHYDVEIYDYITDSDGNKITADDVVFSYKIYTESGKATDFDYFDSVKKTGDYSVEFTWKSKIESITSLAWMLSNVPIISEKAYNSHNFSTDPVGTGPYKVKEFVTDSYIIQEARDDYWQTDELRLARTKENVQTLRIDFITDSAQLLIALENGTSMLDTNISATDLPTLLEGGEYAGKFTIASDYSTDVMCILPNLAEGKLTSDVNLRMAVWYALDSQGFVDSLGSDVYEPCTVFSTPRLNDYQEQWSTWDNYMTNYDLDKAKDYLAKSSYNGETLKILTEQFPPDKLTIAQVMQNYLQAIGINCEIVQEEHPVALEDAANSDNWDFWMGSSTYADSTVHKINQWLGKNYGFTAGESETYLEDTKLDDLLLTAGNVDTYNTQTTEDLMNYIIENGYLYACCYSKVYEAYNPVFAQLYVDQYLGGVAAINACEFYLD